MNKTGHWISLKDRHPNYGDSVMVYRPSSRYPVDVDVFWTYAPNDVTHWMPFPPPPVDDDPTTDGVCNGEGN